MAVGKNIKNVVDEGVFMYNFDHFFDSPFDVPGIKTKATTKDILDAVKES